VTNKNELTPPPAQWWFRRLDNESLEEIALYHQWLARDRWDRAGDTAKALLKRFQKYLDP